MKLGRILCLLLALALLVPAAVAEEETDVIEKYEEVGEVDLMDPQVYDSDRTPPLSGGGTLFVSPSTVELTEGDRFPMRVTFRAYGRVFFNASDPQVLDHEWINDWVDNTSTLYITARRAGTTTVTITNDQNSDTASFFVKVYKQRIDFDVTPQSLALDVGEMEDIWVTFTAPYGYVYWERSNDVVSCRWGESYHGQGMYLHVTGNRQGTSSIKISNDYNGGWYTIPVTVNYVPGPYRRAGKRDGKQKNRALLVGEGAFKESAPRMRSDAMTFQKTLTKVRGSNGQKWSVVTKFDVSNVNLKKAIYNAFKNADEDDVSLFFLSTHGNNHATDELAGAQILVPDGEYMTMRELADILKAVPGKVIILLGSCGSGAGVFRSYSEQNQAQTIRDAVRARDRAVIDAFAEADPGIWEDEPCNAIDMSPDAVNTGELRVYNKFYVLTSTRYQELSWGYEGRNPYTLFTKWLTNGLGVSGRMPADSNRDGKVTLNEMFKYISKVGDNYPVTIDGRTYYQHVQVYPKKSKFVLFKR